MRNFARYHESGLIPSIFRVTKIVYLGFLGLLKSSVILPEGFRAVVSMDSARFPVRASVE